MPLNIQPHPQPKTYTGTLNPTQLDLQTHDPLITPATPLHYHITAQQRHQTLHLHGKLQQTYNCQCVRCLTPFQTTITLPHWTLRLPLNQQNTPNQHQQNQTINLTPHLREHILLNLPQHPQCPQQCPPNNPTTKTNTTHPTTNPIWTPLNQLQPKPPNNHQPNNNH